MSRTKWKHRKGDTYCLITASVIGGDTTPMEIVHYWQGDGFRSVAEAKRVGLADLYRSDDFNIGAIRNGRLAAILWMDEVVDDDPALMSEIAAEVGLAA